MNIEETNKGLGFFINLLGKQTEELKNRVAQAKYCARQINQARLTQYKAWITYLTQVLPKVGAGAGDAGLQLASGMAGRSAATLLMGASRRQLIFTRPRALKSTGLYVLVPPAGLRVPLLSEPTVFASARWLATVSYLRQGAHAKRTHGLSFHRARFL